MTRIKMVSFDIEEQSTDAVTKLVQDSLATLKPLQLTEITCARNQSGTVSVLLRSKNQIWFNNWQRRVKICFGVDLQEEFIKRQNEATLMSLKHPRHSTIIYQVVSHQLSRAPTLVSLTRAPTLTHQLSRAPTHPPSHR